VKRLVEQRIAMVEDQPADARAHALLGAAYFANGLRLPAAESFAQAAALEPDEPLWPYYGARALMQLGRAEEARELLARALELDEHFAPAHLIHARMLFEDGELGAARAAFERAHELEPAQAQPLVGLSTIALDEGDPLRARDLAERALAAHPDHRHARFALGAALVALGDTVRGRAEMEAGADSFDSTLPTSFTVEIVKAEVNRAESLSRASRLLNDGDASSALVLLDQLARDFPDDPLVHNNRGNALQFVGRLNDSIAALERAVQIDPRLERSWASLARLYLRSDRLPEARDAASKAVEINAANADAWSDLSVIKRKQGDLSGALQAARNALELAPNTAAHHTSLGNVYLAAGQLEAAVGPLQRAADLEPTDSQFQIGLASVLIGLSRFDEARSALAHARALDPQTPGLRQLEDKLSLADR
jgi:tetratricopeptide (TPR) repeat protein